MKRLYVGNLNFSTTEDEIRSAFAMHGKVDSVHLVTDRQTFKSRGFAFVEMPNDNAAQEAVRALNGAKLAGRTLFVNEARPREERGDFRLSEHRRRGQRW